MGKTVKDTDWLGNARETHYNDKGEKTGTTSFEKTWLGDNVQVHRDTSGEKTGTTTKESTFFSGDRAVHRDTSGNITGYTEDGTTWLGDPKQTHYDTSGNKTGKSTYEQTIFGSPYKHHTGENPKPGGNAEPKHYTYDSSGSSDSSNSTSPSNISFGSFILLMIVIGFLVTMCNSISKKVPTSVQSSQPVEQPSPQSEFKREVESQAPASETQSTAPADAQAEPAVAKPAETPAATVETAPAETRATTRTISVNYPNFLLPSTRLEFWLVENGVETRSLPIANWYQVGGTIIINLAEAVPDGISYSVKQFPPLQHSNQPRTVYVPNQVMMPGHRYRSY